jgi:hypothetical protein
MTTTTEVTMDTETTTAKFETREAWLQAAASKLWEMMVEKLTPLADKGKIPAIETELPFIYVSVGFPGGGSPRKRIGECWHTSASSDEKNHVFVSPVLADVVDVLATELHELVHVWNNGKDGHKGPFTKAIRALGLEGKPTATVAGEALTETLTELAKELGEFEHAGLRLGGVTIKKQTTRMLKLSCPVGDCDEEGNTYVKRTTRKWLDLMSSRGVWETCPFHDEEMDLA